MTSLTAIRTRRYRRRQRFTHTYVCDPYTDDMLYLRRILGTRSVARTVALALRHLAEQIRRGEVITPYGFDPEVDGIPAATKTATVDQGDEEPVSFL